ncbi:MAG TPA: hypothetical protein PLD51_08315 [Pontiellaceae bacterium]|nr:hypothetical protein [Pontiellaceae bacterium]
MKALRILLALVLLSAAAALSVAALIATNARAMEFVIRQVLARTAPQVQEFRIGSLDYSFPASWTLERVQAAVPLQGRPVRLFANQLEIKDAQHLLKEGASMQLEVRGAEAAYEQLKVRGAACAVDLSRSASGLSYRGTASLETVLRSPLSLSDITAEFTGNEQELVLNRLTAAVYGGRLSGSGRAVFGPPATYTAALEVQALDCAELEQALGGVFRELGGKLSGQLQLAGSGRRIDEFDTAWSMPSGGAVSAELLSSIADYLPDSAQKKRIDFLIRSGGKLAVESFQVTLKNDSPEQLSGIIGLKSREANLELNITHEIRVDARIDALLQAWQAVFK